MRGLISDESQRVRPVVDCSAVWLHPTGNNRVTFRGFTLRHRRL